MIFTENKQSDILYVDNIGDIAELLKDYQGRKIAVILSKSQNDIADELVCGLKGCKVNPVVYDLDDGELCKSIIGANRLTRFLDDNGFTRSDAILNVGGGTVCDLGGFVASIYNRGIDYFNLPTTLLCAVDACIGGKTAIDCNSIKNHWGTIWHPKKVFIVKAILESIPAKLIRSGLSEIVKYAVIDHVFLEYLIGFDSDKIADNLPNIVRKCLEIKARFVEADERDVGVRRNLNAGHTVAHAVESASGYIVTHAYAVEYGLIKETEMAYKAGLIGDKRYNELNELFGRFFAVNIPEQFLVREDILSSMLKDKKNTGDKICFVLPNESSVEPVYFDMERVRELF